MLRVFGKARIQHGDTGVVYQIDKDSLDFDEEAHQTRRRIFIDDQTVRRRGRGREPIEHHATFEHEQLGTLIWTVWEDSFGSIDHHNYNIGNHELLKNFNFSLDDRIPDEEDDRQNRIDEMIGWFHENFEDPQMELPYDKELGFLWLYGGPFDASDVLQDNFPDEDYDIIEVAVEAIEFDGTNEWAPISGTKYYNDEDYLNEDPIIDYDIKKINDRLNTLIDNAPAPTTDPAFAFGEDNLLHIIDPPDNQPVDSQNNLLNGLRTITDDLLQSLRGANAHQDLIPIIEKYKESLLGDEISISQLYWCGIRLDKITQIIKRGIAEKELPSLPTNTETYLESALEIHGTYIMSNPEGQRLVDASAAYHRTPEQTQELKTAGDQFANSIAENSDLFGADVQEHFRDFSSDIGNGQHPERSNQSFGNTVTNFFSSILRWMKTPKGTIASVIFGGAVAKSTPGQMAITAGANLIDKAWIFLTNTASSIKVFATQSPWLADVIQFLEYIRPIIGF